MSYIWKGVSFPALWIVYGLSLIRNVIVTMKNFHHKCPTSALYICLVIYYKIVDWFAFFFCVGLSTYYKKNVPGKGLYVGILMKTYNTSPMCTVIAPIDLNVFLFIVCIYKCTQ
jgi:hypothetical protein